MKKRIMTMLLLFLGVFVVGFSAVNAEAEIKITCGSTECVKSTFIVDPLDSSNTASSGYYSDYAEYPSVGNKNIALAAAERAVGAEDTGISFVTKYIENESFADSVTQTSANVINIIFMILLPIACIAVCIYVYIRRKNS